MRAFRFRKYPFIPHTCLRPEKISLLEANLNGVAINPLISQSNCEWKGHRQAKTLSGTYNWVHVPQQRPSWSAGEISSVAPYLSQGALSRWAVPPARRNPPLVVGRTLSSRPPRRAAWRADCNTTHTHSVSYTARKYNTGAGGAKIFKVREPCESNHKPLDGWFHNNETNLVLAPDDITVEWLLLLFDVCVCDLSTWSVHTNLFSLVFHNPHSILGVGCTVHTLCAAARPLRKTLTK